MAKCILTDLQYSSKDYSRFAHCSDQIIGGDKSLDADFLVHDSCVALKALALTT